MDFGIALGEVSFNHQDFVNGDGCTRGRSPIAWELVAVDGNCSVPSFSDSRYFTGTGYNIWPDGIRLEIGGDSKIFIRSLFL